MAFNSLAYLLFLPAALVLYHLAGARRGAALIALGLVFYAAAGDPALPGYLAASTLVAWFAGRAIERRRARPGAVALFWGFASAQVGLLVASRLCGSGSPGGALGVSYFVFQALAYQADVFLERCPAEPRLADLLLFFGFFPKLLQGPIERAENLLPQVRRPAILTYAALRSGLLLIAFGLLRKTVFADRFALYVENVFADPGRYGVPALILSVYLYALQIYFDFAGYTDIARGSARLFGFELSANFRRPYAALDIADFWRRWHISLSAWILDYLFKPLQAALRGWGTAGTSAALLAAFALCGLWHGFAPTFLAWGLLHGAAQVARLLAQRPLKLWKGRPVFKAAAWLLTFHTVCLGWVLFRSPSLAAAGDYLAGCLRGGGSATLAVPLGHPFNLLLVLAAAAAALVLEWRFEDADAFAGRVAGLGAAGRWTTYLALAVAVELLGVTAAKGGFVYFQF